MNSHLQQQGQTIRWTGEKFEPKALELYRINTRALKAKDEIAYQRVELTMVESTQKIELRPELKANNKDINELQALKLELERIRTQMTVEMSSVVEKMNMVENNLQQQIINITSSVAEKMNMIEKNLIAISRLMVLNSLNPSTIKHKCFSVGFGYLFRENRLPALPNRENVSLTLIQERNRCIEAKIKHFRIFMRNRRFF